MAELLVSYVRRGAGLPFVWGACDCTLWVADWVRLVRGVDPAAALRGRYRTRLGAARHLSRAGGLLATVRPAMAAAGLVETTDTKPGDVAIVRDGGGQELAAIRGARGWIARTEKGLVMDDFPVLVAWSV